MHRLVHPVKANAAAKTHGDTIVEVLLCIAIVGAVIAGSYALSSRSLQQGVTASERTEASKLAESQVEALKLRQKSTDEIWTGNFIAADMSFCLDTSATSQITLAGDPNPAWLPQDNQTGDLDNLRIDGSGGPYNAQCAEVGGGGNAKYFINISTPSAASPRPTYLVTVRWIPAGSNYNSADASTYGRLNQTSLYYRF